MKDNLVIRLESPAFAAEDVQVYSLTGREVISQLFEFQLHLVCSDAGAIDEDTLLASPATLVWTHNDVEMRRVHGMICALHDVGHTEASRADYRVTFVPRAWRTTLSETLDVFLDLSVPDVIREKLKLAGLAEGDDFEFRLRASYPKREFVVQYRESDLNFISRLAEHLGVAFSFEHATGRDVMVFTDDNTGLTPIEGDDAVPFHPHHVEDMGRGRCFAIETVVRTLPARYVVRDYNYRMPGVDMMSAAKVSDTPTGDVIEYGPHIKTPDEGNKLARIRAEELRAQRKVFEGAANVATLRAGATFTLEGHPRGDLKLLITEVHHRAQQNVLGTGRDEDEDYRAEFRAIPASTPYRPPRITPKPVVSGLITGIVDAAAKGPYAELDGDGRYKVRFMFDTADRSGGQASRPVRMAQPHAGPGYGMHFPMRSGVEVVLACVNGDPDRPIIAGTVPNPQTASPVTQDNGTRNIIRTGGSNEINIEDAEGDTRMKFSVPYSNTTFQLGSPNAPEMGAALTTETAWTQVAGSAVSTITSALNVAADISAFSTLESITAIAGVPKSLAKKIQAVAKIGDSMLGVASSTLDMAKKAWNLPAAGAAEDSARLALKIEKQTTAVAAADAEYKATGDDDRVAKLQAELAEIDKQIAQHEQALAAQKQAADAKFQQDTTAALVERDKVRTENDAAEREARAKGVAPPAPKPLPPLPVKPADPTDPQIAELQKKRAEKAQELNAAQAKAKKDKAALTNAQTELADMNAKKAIADGLVKSQQADWDAGPGDAVAAVEFGIAAAKVGTGLLTSKTGEKIISAVAKIWNNATTVTALAASNGFAKALKHISKTAGRIPSHGVTIVEPHNIQGSTVSSVLYGVGNTLVYGTKGALFGSPAEASLVAGGRVLVHAVGAAEVAGKGKLLITSANLIDAESKKAIKVHSGEDTTMHADKTFKITSKEAMDIKTEDVFTLDVTKDHKQTCKENLTLDVTKDATTTVKENYKLTVTKKTEVSADESFEAKSGDMHFKAEKSGALAAGASDVGLKVSKNDAKIYKSGSRCFVDDGKAELVSKNVKINGSGGVTVNGTRIDLD